MNINFQLETSDITSSNINIAQNQIELKENGFIIISNIKREIKDLYKIV